MNRYLKIGLFVAGILLLGYVGLRAFFYKYIQPDEVGVWMTNGGNNGPADYQTWQGHFPIDFNPLTRGFVIPAQPWTVDMNPGVVYSRQKGSWTYDPKFTILVDRNQAPLVCFRNNNLLRSGDDEKFFNAVGDHLLSVIVIKAFQEQVGTKSDSTLLSNTLLTQQIIEDTIRNRFLRVGYVLETFACNLNPPESIIAKNKAANDAEAAAITAKSEVIQAEASAKVKVAEARADAEAMLVTARANAEAVRLQQEQLTPLYIQRLWIDSWDGKLPTTFASGQPTFMFGLK